MATPSNTTPLRMYVGKALTAEVRICAFLRSFMVIKDLVLCIQNSLWNLNIFWPKISFGKVKIFKAKQVL
jgi:hypothetical protein